MQGCHIQLCTQELQQQLTNFQEQKPAVWEGKLWSFNLANVSIGHGAVAEAVEQLPEVCRAV